MCESRKVMLIAIALSAFGAENNFVAEGKDIRFEDNYPRIKQTWPPSQYSETSLAADMENWGLEPRLDFKTYRFGHSISIGR